MEINSEHIDKTPLNHLYGYKKILLKNDETSSNITQVALGYLDAGDYVEEHMHPTMEEFFYILEGSGKIYISDILFEIEPNKLFKVSPNTTHSIKAISQLNFLYWGVSV